MTAARQTHPEMLRIFKSQVNVCAGQHGFDDVRGPGDGYLRLKRNSESLAVSAETNWNKLASQSTPLREVWPRPSRAERGGLHLSRGIQRVAHARRRMPDEGPSRCKNSTACPYLPKPAEEKPACSKSAL